MVPIILGTLKTIGIILLVLLAILLLLLLAVLFVPVKYGITGELNGEVKQAKVKMTWFLKLVRFRADYVFPENPVISLKILWIDIWKIMNRPKKEPQNKRKKKEKKNTVKTDTKFDKLSEDGVQDKEGNYIQEQKESEPIAYPVEENTESEKKKCGLKEKVEKIIFKITSLYDKIKNIKNNIQYYLDVMQEKETQELLKDSKGLLLNIWKSAGPKIFQINGLFGFDSPDVTGKVYGYYCMVLPVVGEYIRLEPDFEAKRLEADCNIKGKITIFILLKNGLKIYFDKRLQTLINKLKDGGKKNG